MPIQAPAVPDAIPGPCAPPSSVDPSSADGPSRWAVAETWKNVAGYAATIALAVAAMAFALELWRGDLRVPLIYHGDDLSAQMVVQSTIESGWFLDNPRLGAPGAQDLRDYPTPDYLHVAVIKLLGYVLPDAATVLNLYYLLSFPLTALSAYFTLRRFGLDRRPSLTAAVLYCCAPYHFMQFNAGHLFLAAYYLLPPMILVLVRVYLGRGPFRRRTDAAGAVLVSLLTGIGGVYYAFFSCFLLLAAGARATFRDREWRHLAGAAALILCIAASLGAALAPTLLYHVRHGKNPTVADRSPVEADVYGVNVTEMLMPVQGHRIKYLAKLREAYLAPPRQSTWSAPLGIAASLGFLSLLGRFLWRRRDRTERAEDALAYLNLAALLLGTVGGFGSLFAFCVSPMIRCYHRIGVLIAFFALAGLFLALQRLAGRYAQTRWAAAVYAAGLAALLVLGVLDQAARWNIPAYDECRVEFASDADLGRRMEAALPAGAMVYQMPYQPFPEFGPVQSLSDYELLRPYLHTRTLRFSYGAMQGRDADPGQAALAVRPLPEVVETLALTGFRGVYLDRVGYADNGARVEADLSRLLGGPPLVSLNGRQVFFDMTSYVQALRGRFTDEEWEERKDAALHPVTLTWDRPFSGVEQGPDGLSWRWCGAEGRLHVFNPSRGTRKVALKMECATWTGAAPSHLVVDGDLMHREMPLTAERRPLQLDLLVPPGDQVLRFSCDGPRLRSSDPRELVFSVWNVECRLAP